MKTVHILFIFLAMAVPALAQLPASGSQETAQRGLNGEAMERCKTDIRKFCGSANLKQECLVAHWTKISNACQDSLARPMGPGGEGG